MPFFLKIAFHPPDLLTPPRRHQQSQYSFEYSDSFTYNTPLCSYMTADELITKSQSGSLFIATHVDHKKFYREVAADEASCSDPPGSDVGASITKSSTTGFSYANGICTYKTNTNLIPVGVEKIKMAILHGYSTLSGNFDAATNPKTYVRRKGDDTDYMTIKGSDLSLSVADLLEIAGIDLDETYDNQPNGVTPAAGLVGVGTSADVFPRPRLTGLRVSIAIQYYNHNLEITGGTSALGTPDIYAIAEVDASLAWTSRGQKISYRTNTTDWDSPFDANGQPQGGMEDMYVYGINIDVSATGNVAAFNFQLFIQTIVSGLVFLGVAKTVVDLVAMNGLGVKSKLYKSFIQEEVDLESECARYAINALMASEFFKKKDADGSGQLDLNEIQEMLKQTFNSAAEAGDAETGVMSLSDNEIAALALYILRSCDEDREELRLQGKEKGLDELATSTISLREFLNLSSSSSVTVKALKEIVELTNLDEMVEEEEYKTGQGGLAMRSERGGLALEKPATAAYPGVPDAV